MKLEVGQFFKINGKEYGLLDIIDFENVQYYLFSIKSNGKLDYKFYTIDYYDNEKFELNTIKDEELKMKLLEIAESRIDLEEVLYSSEN